jgi:CheY-like chemotaxis protein
VSFSADARIQQRIVALMQRVLIVDAQMASIKLVADLLRDIGRCQIWTAPDVAKGLALAEQIDPYIVFVSHSPGVDGAAFTRALRRSEMACRKAPVIVISAEATAAVIIGARDAGAHEFLRKPFTIKDLMRRLEAVAARPRDWVEGVGYVGPDRRRFNSGDYAGPRKRRVDQAATPDEARVLQALRIIKAGLAAIETDPVQVLRALTAQSEQLRDSLQAKSDVNLRVSAVVMNQRLLAMTPATLTVEEIEPLARPLLAYLPAGEESRTRSAA